MNIWKTFLGTIILIIIMNLLGVISSWASYLNNIPIAIYSLINTFIIVIVYIYFIRFYFKKDYIFDIKTSFVHFNENILFILIPIAVGLKIFQEPFFEIYRRITSSEEFPSQVLNINTQLDYQFVIRAIPALVIAPIFEELIFRKYFIDSLAKKYSFVKSILYSSLCFALYHLPNFSNLLPTFFLGLVAGYLYVKSKKIIIPIILHFLLNFNIALLKLYGKTLLDSIDKLNLNIYYWIFFLIGIILLGGGLFLFNHYIEKIKNSKLET
jgi:membrane protease YdiL (CAAX protease family)